jgi:excisionase family DNA binding protein
MSAALKISRDEELNHITSEQISSLKSRKWLTAEEAAEYLRLPSVGMVRYLVCERRIPFYKLGRSLRFKASDLDSVIESSRVLRRI